MNEIIKAKTDSKFEQMGSYSRLIAVGDLIFVSNTAGRNPRTKKLPEDLTQQTLQVFENIEAALRSVDAVLADVVAARVFVQFPGDVDVVMAAYAKKMAGIEPVLTLTSPPLGSPEYKVEMEVTAYRGASKATVKTIRIQQ